MKRVTLVLFLLLFAALVVTFVSCAPSPADEAEAESAISADATTTEEAALATAAPQEDPTATPTVRATTADPTAPATVTPPATATTDLTAATADATNIPEIPGALIAVSFGSTVGVLLDDFPPEMRDRVAAELMQQPEDVWLARAERQMRLLKLRLNFRNFFQPGKGQLPLPPRELWNFALDAAGPARETIQGHDLVVWPYTFSSTLLTDAASPAVAEPALAAEGGVWNEPFVFPADPDMLLQRTGNACLNEAGFPPHSYDSENVYHFYDFACTADSVGAAGCHRTERPLSSCREALADSVGEIETAVRFERLPWDDALADSVRLGEVTNLEAPDLLVVGDDLNVNRIVYRYIEADDCAIEEGAVGGSGWRRLLQFDATLQNVGAEALHVGAVVSEDLEHHVFEYSACHDHFHYSNYGSFMLRDRNDVSASKQAFCVQSTSRYSNNETSPLIHDYTCSFQGIQAGWVDEYPAGLDVQWIDITDMNVPEDGVDVQLGFASNEERFLCEGIPVTNENGERLWEATGQTTADGHEVERPQCEFIPAWDANNYDERDVSVPLVGSFVTAACANGEVGPLRNCGFTSVPAENDNSCTPGETVTLDLETADDSAMQVLRVCERSAALGIGVACTYEDATANVVLDAGSSSVSFACPALRDGEEDEGGYALYTAPVWPQDAAATLALRP